MADGEQQKENHQKRVLVTGGAGYIGSHTTLELVSAGFHVTIIDNLANSNPKAVDRVRQIAAAQHDLPSDQVPLSLHELDLCDASGLNKLLASLPPFDAVIHFAGHKAVGESVSRPIVYYENNLVSTLNLLKAMEAQQCNKLVFSSSATVYGDYQGTEALISETSPLSATNPYGRTKLYIEGILRDVACSSPGKWKIAILRYFNPVGAHPSGRIGEDPNGIPNNLTPYILQVACGKREYLSVFGSDYSTKDGTGVRDYIHVMDLAKGHVAALQEALFGAAIDSDVDEFNLGTGVGVSVLEMVASVSAAVGKQIPYKMANRRPGDIGVCVCNPTKAKKKLGWVASRTLKEASEDGWRWQSQNPNGYNSS